MNRHPYATFVRLLDYDPYRIHLFSPLIKCIILGRSTDVLAKPSATNGMGLTSKRGVRPRYLLAPPELSHPKPSILYNFISCSVIISHQQQKMPRQIKLSSIREVAKKPSPYLSYRIWACITTPTRDPPISIPLSSPSTRAGLPSMANHISFIYFCSFKAFLGRVPLRTYPYYISLHLHAMAGTDLASSIGTWAAVLLALIALFGVIGPYYIWRTLRSARYVAISGIDDPSRRFVSKGVPIWRSGGQAVRVRKTIRIPDLTGLPALKVWMAVVMVVSWHEWTTR